MTEEPTNVRFRITKKRVAVILIILAIPSFTFLFFRYVAPITTWNYEGQNIGFRISLRDAQKVPIISNGAKNDSDFNVRDALVRDDVKNITILFKNTDDKDNTLYILEEQEIIKSLTVAYFYSPVLQLHQPPGFNAVEVSSYSNITASQTNPKIVLVHPNYGNETVVRQDGYIIYVEAKNTNNFDSDKMQFDLATVRLMMAILNIKIQ